MIALDHLQVALSGMHLIEASAGTGKTYAIACLYLRILIEKELTPEQILVVTYTEAATKELRGRIRSRIRETIGVIDGAATSDPFLQGLCAACNGRDGGASRARELLDRALRSFDTASIFTIHGFCLRALKDNAFESGSLYDTELVTDQTPLLREVVEDFWRIHFFSAKAPLLAIALRAKATVDSFMQFARGLLGNDGTRIIPSFSPDRIETIELSCRNGFAAVQREWRGNRKEITDLLSADKGLSRSKETYKEELLDDLFSQMDQFVSGSNPYDLPADFKKWCRSGIVKGTKPKGTAPSHCFFDLCEQLQNCIDERFLALRSQLVDFCRIQLPLRKQQKNIRFFDDLLNDLYGALSGAAGEALAAILRSRYRAALIDEFQDTDPVQYAIFRTIYAAPEATLFLIGDPKQAIYSFRGADIFAYMQAAGDVPEQNRATLTSNWRSTPRLLTAFNRVFSDEKNPFLYDQIAYHQVSSGREETGADLTCGVGASAPLQIWLMPPADDGGPIKVSDADKQVPAAVATEIARLLQQGAAGEALIGDKPVVPGDIAVIVRSHRQAGAVKNALSQLTIPSVMRSDMTIFATDEAQEVCLLLLALAEPGNAAYLRAALITGIMGRTGSDIARLLEDEQEWDVCLEQFREYHHIWLEKGFMVMTRLLLAREGIRGRLLGYPDGERRLTNLLHCFEVIHGKAHEGAIGMEGLVTWFYERVSAGESSDEHVIRLETDEQAVRIVTAHISKGLEYPIVFCPFMWGGIREENEIISYHDEFALVKDFGSPDRAGHLAEAYRESLAESLRLLYVVLTRARYRCYLSAGKVVSAGKSHPETSPLSYLFHASDSARQSADPVGSLRQEAAGLSAVDMQKQLLQLASTADGTIAVLPMPNSSDAVTWRSQSDTSAAFSCRTFGGTVRSDWRVTSFTAFARHESGSTELPDRDESQAGAVAAKQPLVRELPEATSIFAFPAGAQAGIFMHAVFEELDFADCSQVSIEKVVANCLKKYGYDAGWLPAVSAMAQSVVTTPLPAPDNAFRLCDLKQGSWIPELEFFFPLAFITSDRLRDCLQRAGAQSDPVNLRKVAAALQFRPAQGMVRGFMDMVFEHNGRYYLLDWKSNHLGSRIEDYNQRAIQAEMERHLYPLQYLLYTVALNRYLALRAPDYRYETHFGGVYYLFLRGVGSRQDEQYGIFRDLPSRELVDTLTNALIQAGG